MSTRKPKAPAGFVLTKHDGYFMNVKGFQIEGKPAADAKLAPDGVIGVPHFDDAEPFLAATSADGTIEGYSPNCEVRPIKDGWVPPVYTLHSKEEAP